MHDDGARGEVAEALVVAGEQHGHAGHEPTRGDEEVGDLERGADRRLSKSNRRALRGDDTDAQGALADCLAAPQRLEDHGIPEDREEGEERHDDRGDPSGDGRAGRVPDQPEREQYEEQASQLDRQIESDRQHTRPERREPQLEHDRLGCDDAVTLGAGTR